MKSESKRLCLPCTDGINEHEDSILTTLISLLELSTCTEWIRAYQGTAKPDNQYGTVHIQSIDHGVLKESGNIEKGKKEGCVGYYGDHTISVKLDVYGDNGTENKDFPYGSAMDVLVRLSDRYHVDGLKNLFADSEMKITDFGMISNIPDFENEQYISRSSQTIEICLGRRIGIVETMYDNVCINIKNDCQEK